MLRMPFYIHIDDPQFKGWDADGNRASPWPGQRVLGPFTDDPDTGVSGLDQALAQAVSDAASGMGVAAGVYDEENSQMLAYVPTDEEIEGARAVLRNKDSGDDHRDEANDKIARRAAAGRAKTVYPRSEIKRRGEAELKRRLKRAALELASEAERDRALQAFLPEGVTVADLREQGVVR